MFSKQDLTKTRELPKLGGTPAKKTNVKALVLTALLIALIMLFGVSIGTIMVGPVGITMMHIPVAVGAVMLGMEYGALLGFVMGLVSFLIATFTPFVGAFAFSPFVALPGSENGSVWALVVCFVPRILIGIGAAVSYKLFKKVCKENLAWGIAGAVGSLINTIFVLTFIATFFGEQWAGINGIAQNALLGTMLLTVFSNGIPEATVAFLVCFGIGSAQQAIADRKSRFISDALRPLEEENAALRADNERLRSASPIDFSSDDSSYSDAPVSVLPDEEISDENSLAPDDISEINISSPDITSESDIPDPYGK